VRAGVLFCLEDGSGLYKKGQLVSLVICFPSGVSTLTLRSMVCTVGEVNASRDYFVPRTRGVTI